MAYMARIRGVEPEQANLLSRLIYWFTKRKLGRLVTPVKITAHQTRLLRAMGQMEVAQMAMRDVDPALKALAGIKAATLVGCPF